MDLKDKLARLRLPPAKPARLGPDEDLGGTPPSREASDRVLAALAARRVRGGVRPSAAPLPQEHLFDHAHRHGDGELGGARLAAGELLAVLALDESLRDVDPLTLLYLDTETTGLAGGTGTVPFLIGLAWFEPHGFKIEQLLLTRLGHEAPLLERLRARLSRASAIVTYNGKSFDWPLLRSRYVMNRLPAPSQPRHVDLLHCARRVFGAGAGAGQPACRLVDMEVRVLSYHRRGDLDGAEVPERFFRFLRSNDSALLAPVLAHNVQDLCALAALLGRLTELVTMGRAPTAAEALGLGRLHQRARSVERAIWFARTACELEGGQAQRAEAHALLARLLAGRGEFREAAEALQAALRHAAPEDRPALHLSLAKLHEHRLRDVATALRHARSAFGVEPHEQHLRRLARLGRAAPEQSLDS